MSDYSIPVLWVSGPSGVGKTAVGWKVYSELLRDGTKAAYVDIDQLGMCYREPESDPGRYTMKARIAGAVVTNFHSAGAQCVVISGVIDHHHGVPKEEFPDATVKLYWLSADADDLRRRFAARGTRLEEIDQAIRDAEDANPTNFADAIVETTGRSVEEVATLVRDRASWPTLDRSAESSITTTLEVMGSTAGRVLWLFGAVGVGKSTVGFAAYLAMLRTGLMTGYVDVGQLGFFGDEADHQLKGRNLAAVWRTYRAAGAEGLIVVGAIENESSMKAYEDALPAATITWCRLHADPDRLTERILLRGQGRGSWPEPGDRLRGRPSNELLDIARDAAADAEAMERSSIGHRIDASQRTVDEAADDVLARASWHRAPPRKS